MASFNLVHQPWIPVVVAGRRTEVSLLDAVTDAADIDGLALDDPLPAVAVLRQVLLPVLLDAVEPARSQDDWADRWDAADLGVKQVREYLDRWQARFDLLDTQAPFAQVAGLRTAKNETKPVSLLIPALASGNNVPLFSARTEAEPPALTLAQAARAVLVAHCFDTAAIKSGAEGDPKVANGKTTGNPTGPLGQLGVIVPAGRSLAHTLLLNLPILPGGLGKDDRPHWRADPVTPAWSKRPALGLLDLLTWQSRRIRLVPDPAGAGPETVSQVVLTAGDRLDPLPIDVEPHTAWRQVASPKAGDPPSRPLRHQAGLSAWRGLQSLLATSAPSEDKTTSSLLVRQIARLRGERLLPPDTWLQVLTVGVEYGNQSAVVEDVIVDEIPLPVAALTVDAPVRGLLLDVARQAEELRIAANRLGDDLRAACGADKVPWDKSQRLGEVVVHELTPTVRRLLAGLTREPDRCEDAAEAWRQVARRIALDAAEPLLAAAPPEAFLGRQVSERFAQRLSTAEAFYRAAITRILGPATTATEPPIQMGA